ncbi:type II toxin-antitoxin system RelE/ParE family toxin [Paracoccus siganidrum]|nr:type II toxin-antitoxin system RelE/ParE family toxin [Paracoccus siganidrum]
MNMQLGLPTGKSENSRFFGACPNYLVVYAEAGETLVILRVLHAAQ